MSDCARYLEDLALLLSDEIEPGRRASLERHLATCDSCARERAAIAGAFDDLRAAEVPDPGPVYWSGFEARFRTRLLARRAAARRRMALTAAAAVLVAVAALGLLVVRRAGGGTAGGPVVVGPAGGASTIAAEGRATGAAGGAATVDATEGEAAEARLEAALHAVRGRASGDAEFEAILDEIVPGDPYAFTGVGAATGPEGSSGV